MQVSTCIACISFEEPVFRKRLFLQFFFFFFAGVHVHFSFMKKVPLLPIFLNCDLGHLLYLLPTISAISFAEIILVDHEAALKLFKWDQTPSKKKK